MEQKTRAFRALLTLMIMATSPLSLAPAHLTTDHFRQTDHDNPGLFDIVEDFIEEQSQYQPNGEIWVIFDLDETLIAHHPLYKVTSDKIKAQFEDTQKRNIGSILIQKHTIAPMHPEMPDWIRALKKREKVKPLCLTLANVGPYGTIGDVPAFRISQLKRIGLSFADTFPELDTQKIYPVGENEVCGYRDGVLFTNRIKTRINVTRGEITGELCSKGLVLQTFLKDVTSRGMSLPKAIIFIDDKHEHIESVSKTMELYPEVSFASVEYKQYETERALLLEERYPEIATSLDRCADRLIDVLEEKCWKSELEADSLKLFSQDHQNPLATFDAFSVIAPNKNETV